MMKLLKTVVVVGIVMMFGAAVSAQRGTPPSGGRTGGTPPAGARPGGEGRTGGEGREGQPAKPPSGKPTKPCKPTATKPC